MGRLFRAFKAEQRKLWSKGNLLGCFVIIFVLAFALAFLCSTVRFAGIEPQGFFLSDHAVPAFENNSSENWRARTEEKIKALEQEISYSALLLNDATGPRKAAVERQMAQYVREMQVAQYRLDNSLPVADWAGNYSLILCLWMMTPFVAVFTSVYASDMFAGEYVRGTARIIFSRPITRAKIYFAKLFSAILLGMLFMGVAYAAAGIGCGVLMAPQSGMYVGFLNGKPYQTTWGSHVFTVYLCCCASVALCVALCAAAGNLSRSRGVSAACASVLAIGTVIAAPLGGLINADFVGVLLPFCYDLTVPLCSVPYNSGCSFVACAVSAAVHFLAFSFTGYTAFRRDV